MAIRKDWLPGSREAILVMVKTWLIIILAKLQQWGIPESVSKNLETLATNAENAFDTAQNESTRTPVATTRCREAFDALIAEMRDMKKRYFLSPPLLDSDLVSLGLTPPDTTHTSAGEPTDQVQVETYLIGRHELGVKISYVTGSAASPANKGYRIWYSVIAPGETPPTNPDDLRKSFFTQRKKDKIEFGYGDSGKTAYFAVVIENNGKTGPWGPIVSALIP
ncbi:MAG: hypothetical protein LBJ41_09445 [Treponema sp.]|jgi:hypothetical protein|nr:hypothetical protein [Treponema sp.]